MTESCQTGEIVVLFGRRQAVTILGIMNDEPRL